MMAGRPQPAGIPCRWVGCQVRHFVVYLFLRVRSRPRASRYVASKVRLLHGAARENGVVLDVSDEAGQYRVLGGFVIVVKKMGSGVLGVRPPHCAEAVCCPASPAAKCESPGVMASMAHWVAVPIARVSRGPVVKSALRRRNLRCLRQDRG